MTKFNHYAGRRKEYFRGSLLNSFPGEQVFFLVFGGIFEKFALLS